MQYCSTLASCQSESTIPIGRDRFWDVESEVAVLEEASHGTRKLKLNHCSALAKWSQLLNTVISILILILRHVGPTCLLFQHFFVEKMYSQIFKNLCSVQMVLLPKTEAIVMHCTYVYKVYVYIV